jgi:signal transduction histidine kinase
MYEAGATNSVIETSAKSLPQERPNELPVLLVTLPVSQKQRRLAVTAIQMPPVMGQSGQLQEVIVNLIQNAIDAMDLVDDAHRVLQVRTKFDGGDAISVEIEDTGSGIDPKKSNNIFDAFVTTKPKGMGLGLAISWMIIERHEGQLSVSSANPHGAIFRITLPQMKGSLIYRHRAF